MRNTGLYFLSMTETETHEWVELAIEAMGGKVSALAKAIPVSHQAVRRWRETGRVDNRHVAAIVNVTRGQVRPEQILSDVFEAIDPRYR